MTTSFFRDTARSLRSWRRTPGSAFLVILALGLSSGALIALVSLFNALFWRELPVSHPEELVGVSGRDRAMPVGYPEHIPASMLGPLGSADGVFQAWAAVGRRTPIGQVGGASERLAVESIGGDYFEVLGVQPALGRLLNGHDSDAASPVVALSSSRMLK